jgi:mannose-6-phosphate isomerase-like protein (cupin superfamily)
MEKVNLAEKFSRFTEHWSPKIVGEVQGMHVKLAKLKGEFVWHHHENEDEMFFVFKGRLLLKFRDRDVWIEPGEFLIVPRGLEHCPVAEEEVHLMMIEPAGTLNTGNITDSDRTVAEPDRI